MPPLCPKCNSPMVIRKSKQKGNELHEFWGCPNYPKCNGTRSVDSTCSASIPASSNSKSQPTSPGKEQFDVAGPIKYEGEPFDGFDLMDTYETIACDSSVLTEIRNEKINANAVQYTAKFRVDYTESQGKVSQKQRQLAAIVLRMLCRGSITRNTENVERAIERLFPGDITYTDNDFVGSRLLTKISPPYPYDSKREQYFAEEILGKALGENWQLFTSAQMFIGALGKQDFADNRFAGQRVDFVVSSVSKANKEIIIELDGDEHLSHLDKDNVRNTFLQQNGYKILRIRNESLDTKPEYVTRVLKEELGKRDYLGDPNSVAQKRIIAAKLIHQIQIALTSSLIHATVEPKCTIGIHGDIKGVNASTLDKILQIAIDDLEKLFRNYCILYGEKCFFEISISSRPDAMICIGKANFSAPSTILITDITTTRSIENSIPTYSDLQIATESFDEDLTEKSSGTYYDESVLLYFLDYVFHFKEFREGQLTAIDRLLRSQDTIVLLPTGSGKSLIYQLVALMCPGKIIVISPLVSLMQDQLDNLFYNGISCGISISRDNNCAKAELNNPGIALIYITPERLQIKSFRNAINTMQASSQIFAVAVDEAHCVSEWGHDFRTAYLNIGRTSRAIFNRNNLTPTIIALTGTASTAVLKDIKRELEIKEYDAIITPTTFDRPELKYKVVRTGSEHKSEMLVELLDRVIPDAFGQSTSSFYRLRNDATNCGIVFCPHVKGNYGVLKVRDYLAKIPAKSNVFHGVNSSGNYFERKQDLQEKHQTALNFKNNKTNIIVATKAFGMGIDKPNVRFTVHYGIPSSIESFYQEAGRAGRDGKESLCTLILSNDNAKLNNYILDPTTSLDEIQNIIAKQNEQFFEQKDDISRVMWFHANAFRGVDFEASRVEAVVKKLFIGEKLRQNEVVLMCGADSEDNSLTNMQKALQRLLVLGVIKDYTVEYSSNEIYIKPGSAEPSDIKSQYAEYVGEYNEGRVLSELRKVDKIEENPRTRYVLNAARVVTEFVYDTIEKGRRRGIREMVNATEAALKSKDPDKTIRQRIVRYFESTYSEELTDVVESKTLGFEIIKNIIDGTRPEDGGEIVGGIRSGNEAAGLRGGVSRFLESTPDHPGLLALRALAELHCIDYNVSAIIDDFKAAANFALNRYSCDDRTLLNFTSYFMQKVIERDQSLFFPLIDVIGEFIDTKALCEALIDDPRLTEDQKSIPALLYFSDLAKSSKKLIENLMEG